MQGHHNLFTGAMPALAEHNNTKFLDLATRNNIELPQLHNGTHYVALSPGELIISRTTFILATTLFLFLTTSSLIIISILAYRHYSRRRAVRDAKAWGRRSTFNHRISMARKEIDLSYSRQHGGCLVHVPENPELGSDEPVEIMEQEKLFEVPALPGRAVREKRKSRFMNLFFDEEVGVWVPKA
ncbi:hypothetical protein LTR62_001169 [Meristemomyces frigidus]|uniref:Uncharacterized protein n=1 Tax=Meristemomyces frigidus TaxID=1508187 RepID=A0AAN7TGB3_9PEZI|nr:hypothetical protein LTR62_001169 [Meristemomyces frigidus]